MGDDEEVIEDVQLPPAARFRQDLVGLRGAGMGRALGIDTVDAIEDIDDAEGWR